MKPLLFLDTETTDLENGRLVEVAYLRGGTMTAVRCKPPVRISYDAMSTHHITEADVINLPRFDELPEYQELKDLVPACILVAHNAKFDIGILKSEGIEADEYIDTRRVAEHLYPNAEMYRLQYFRYYLGCVVEGEAHSASGDVAVLAAVFRKMLMRTMEVHELTAEEEGMAKMIELTHTPVLLLRIPFGKYKGDTFSNICFSDHKYLVWLWGEKKKEEEPDENILFTLEHWVKRRVV